MYEYHYELRTLKQKKHINLLDYKKVLDAIFFDFFKDDLVNAVVIKDGYILKLKTEFKNGATRSLGRKISLESGLKQFVKEYI